TALPADSCDGRPARHRAGLRCTAVLHDLLFISEGVRRGTAWCLRALGGGRHRSLSVLPMGGGAESAEARLVAELRVAPPLAASQAAGRGTFSMATVAVRQSMDVSTLSAS